MTANVKNYFEQGGIDGLNTFVLNQGIGLGASGLISFDDPATSEIYSDGTSLIFKKLNSGEFRYWLSNDSNNSSSVRVVNGNNNSVFKVLSAGRQETINTAQAPSGVFDSADFSGQGIQPLSIIRVGSEAFVTTDKKHNLVNGKIVTIAGVNETEYNGAFSITVVDDYIFKYTVSGTPSTPATGTIYYSVVGLISNAIHSYKEGHALQIDGVQEQGYALLRLQNANNPLRRPDKPSDFWGKSDFIQMGDQDGVFFRIFYNREWTQMIGTHSLASNVSNANPAFQRRAYQQCISYDRVRTPDGWLDYQQFDNGGSKGLYLWANFPGGIKIYAQNKDLILQAAEDIIMLELPTSSAGLPTGALWDDSGTLKRAA